MDVAYASKSWRCFDSADGRAMSGVWEAGPHLERCTWDNVKDLEVSLRGFRQDQLVQCQTRHSLTVNHRQGRINRSVKLRLVTMFCSQIATTQKPRWPSRIAGSRGIQDDVEQSPCGRRETLGVPTNEGEGSLKPLADNIDLGKVLACDIVLEVSGGKKA